MQLLKAQQYVAHETLDSHVFLEGVAGTGKTTAGIERVKALLRAGIPAHRILIWVPQAALGGAYRQALQRSRLKHGINVRIATLGSLSKQGIGLFWQAVAVNELGFSETADPPHFLSLELVQYYMTRFVAPEIQRQDFFNSVHIDPNRLYTQIVDNLNKASQVGFSHNAIADRLKSAWFGDLEQAYIYDDAQACANLFRKQCQLYNMLDFSLQVSLFSQVLWKMTNVRRYLTQQYRHLIIDNIEEDAPVSHDILAEWLPSCDSALVIYDSEAGYRRFLSADPQTALSLKSLCQVQVRLDKQRIMSDDLQAFQAELARSLQRPVEPVAKGSAQAAIHYPVECRYLPQMLDWTADEIRRLIQDEGVSADEIVVVSAIVPDALLFALQTRLAERGILSHSQRPSRALRDEASTRTWMTLAKLAHPHWKLSVHALDLASALRYALADCDPLRARLLSEAVYHDQRLMPFADIKNAELRSRIGFDLGERYERLRLWLDAYQQDFSVPIDIFISKLFGEVLAQAGFGFHQQAQLATNTANLIDSAREFRQIVSQIEPSLEVASEYVRMVDAGVIANQYIREAETLKNSVLIAPAYAFLMTNQATDYQFWLNIGSASWSQRLYQPLTHPYVLSRQWENGRQWTDMDEHETSQETLYLLVSGLIRRCRRGIFLGFSEIGEQGLEQRGMLLMAIQSLLRRLQTGAKHV